jgi:AraC-like DNA-binding protein
MLQDLTHYERERRDCERVQKALLDTRNRVSNEDRRVAAHLLLTHELNLRQKISELADDLKLSANQCYDLFEAEFNPTDGRQGVLKS